MFKGQAQKCPRSKIPTLPPPPQPKTKKKQKEEALGTAATTTINSPLASLLPSGEKEKEEEKRPAPLFPRESCLGLLSHESRTGEAP